jgi:hypothetical protein
VGSLTPFENTKTGDVLLFTFILSDNGGFVKEFILIRFIVEERALGRFFEDGAFSQIRYYAGM